MKPSPLALLDVTLKGWAALMLISAGIGFLQTQQADVPRIIAAHLLFALSLFLAAQPSRIAVFSAALGLVVAIGTIRSYLQDAGSPLPVLIDVTGGGLTAWYAVSVVRSALAKQRQKPKA
ncbi:MAG: hypothetical protein O3A63_05245 [Proteobacteria bacterium]|nr:hypothetical protein [Pseudomonadota bacterium]